MDLTNRKKRPIIRSQDTLRDDRLFIVACDDTYAPKQYFNFFQIPRIQVHVVPTEDGTSAAQHVLERLLKFEYENGDERWLVLDTDHYSSNTHIKSLMGALKQAQHHGIHVALSKPSFDFWLLLHHTDNNYLLDSIEDAVNVENELRSILGQYNKRKLQQSHFPIPSVIDACLRAEQRDSNRRLLERNGSRLYLLWNSIISKAIPSQLPKDFEKLRKR
jgi:hypothetical protein